MSILSHRVLRVKPSPTLAVAAKAKELQAAGRDIVDLGSGEPDFDTPEHIKEAAIEALRQGFTKYTPVAGIPELRQAIVTKMRRDSGLDYRPAEVIVTVGGKQAFYNLMQATLNKGDEVIVPAPYWVSYPDMTLLAGGRPVLVSTRERDGFKLTPKRLAKAISPDTRYLVLNSPSNPTGAAYTSEELTALAEVLLDHPHVWLITDDIYEKIVFDDFRFTTMPQVVPQLKSRTVVLNGLSKAYAMTGWRIGYAVGPAPVIEAMGTIQSQSTSNATSIAQKAAVAALNGPQECIETMRQAFQERRNRVVAALNAIPGLHCRSPEGSFYLYPSAEGWMDRRMPNDKTLTNSSDLAAYLLEDQGVAVVPGTAFSPDPEDPYFRISFATSLPILEDAVTRIRRAGERLR